MPSETPAQSTYEIVGSVLIEYRRRWFAREEAATVNLDDIQHIDWHTPVSTGRPPTIQLWTSAWTGEPVAHARCRAQLRPDDLRGTPAHAQLIDYVTGRGDLTSNVDLNALAPAGRA